MTRKKLLLLSLALAAAAAVVLLVLLPGRRDPGAIYEELRQSVTLPPVTAPAATAPPATAPTDPAGTDPAPTEPAATEPPYVSPVDFEPLWEINADVYAWIDIPYTNVSYPVLRHPTDDEYYLEHTIEGVKKRPCAIYSESWNTKTFLDPATVLYGHNMRNGTMFGPLKNYRSLDYMREHQIVSVYTPEAEHHYRVFAAVDWSSAYLPAQFDYFSPTGLRDFLTAALASPAALDDTVPWTEDSRFLILSTCATPNTSRFLVLAVEDEALMAPNG